MDSTRINRVILLGCAGAGKSYTARRLSQTLGTPNICLDALWSQQGTNVDIAEFRRKLAVHHQAPRWVSDGNFAQVSFDLRLPEADLVLWLERPRWQCLWNAIRRVFRSGEAHQRADLGKVLTFIWNFDRVNRPRIETLLKTLRPDLKVMRLHSDREIKAMILRLKSRL